jgi:EAL and modified HD-GYP domain-containing signal transduction protein
VTVTETGILEQVALGYSPMIDRNRNVVATRLTVFALRPDAPLDAGQLLQMVGGVWPEGGGKVALNLLSESLLRDLLNAKPSANVMIEVPSFMASDAAHVAALQTLRANGNALLLRGRPASELPADVLPCFTQSIIDIEDDRRAAGVAPSGAAARTIPHIQSGVRTLADMDASFQRGAVAVLGWPMDDAATQPGRKKTQHDLQVIVELMQRLDAEEPVEKLDNTLRRDPTLAFKLMRYINSPAFGLRVEINSFRHAILLLGYKKLKRWLALLLATAGKDVNLRPVMYAAVRRGLLMEELARSSGDEEMRNELFICGVFSLLDKMMGEPFADLMKTIPVPDRVRDALAEGSGPYLPYVNLMLAVESESLFDIRESAEVLLMGAAEINRALLRALASASQIE